MLIENGFRTAGFAADGTLLRAPILREGFRRGVDIIFSGTDVIQRYGCFGTAERTEQPLRFRIPDGTSAAGRAGKCGGFFLGGCLHSVHLLLKMDMKCCNDIIP